MENWDYKKLFAEGNIIGLKNTKLNRIFVHEVFDKETIKYFDLNDTVDWEDYYNQTLSHGRFQIEYIVRYDEHGDIVEKLFDREKDMPEPDPMPELKTGMFGEVTWYQDGDFDEEMAFVVVNDTIVYQKGGYDHLYELNQGNSYHVVKIYNTNVNSFDWCIEANVAWRDQEYQNWLKLNTKQGETK